MLGGYAKICWGVEKCLGGMPTNFVYGFEKKIKKQIFWGGGVVMPKYFTDLKNVGGGGMPTNLWT